MATGCWSQLPSDLLHIITDQILLPDLFQLSRVCSSWRSSSAPMRKYHLERLILIRQHQNKVGFFSPLDDKYYRMKLQGLNPKPMKKKRRKVCGFSNGWLALKCRDLRIELLNLFSGESIHLPSIHHVRKVSMSPDLSVIIATKDIGKYRLFFCRPKLDLSWNPVKNSNGEYIRFYDATYYNGKCYALASTSCFKSRSFVFSSFVVEIEGLDGASSSTNTPPLLGLTRINSISMFIVTSSRRYMMESEGELLIGAADCSAYKLVLDSSNPEPVKDLGDCALFVGRYQSCSVTTATAATTHLARCKRNCIYFTGDPTPHRDGEVFNLKDKTWEDFCFGDR